MKLNDYAFPVIRRTDEPGLTKQEYIAAQILGHLLARSASILPSENSIMQFAQIAATSAQALAQVLEDKSGS